MSIEVVVSKSETTTSTCKESLQVGNVAKMREALLIVKRLFDGRIMFQPAIRKAHKAVDAALSEPPRNCDLYPKDEVRLAYHLHGDGLMTMQAFADWLYAEAKGEAK